MSTQVITVGTTGSLESLQFKGKGVDLRKQGHASIHRISDIVWDETRQLWTVVPTQGKFKGIPICVAELVEAYHGDTQLLGDRYLNCNRAGIPLIAFSEYEEAVAFEVEFIQKCKLSGRSHLVYD